MAKTFIIVAVVKIIAPPPRIFFSLEKHTLNKWHYVYDYSIAKEVYKASMSISKILQMLFSSNDIVFERKKSLVY